MSRRLRRRLERLERPYRPQPARRKDLVWPYGEEQADAPAASGFDFLPFLSQEFLDSTDFFRDSPFARPETATPAPPKGAPPGGGTDGGDAREAVRGTPDRTPR